MTATAWEHQREVREALHTIVSDPQLGIPALSNAQANSFRSPDAPILVADSTDDIVDRLVAASIAVSRMSEEGADRAALAQTLMHPPAGPAPGPLDDSIL